MKPEKTFSENAEYLSESIMKAIELAVPHTWTTWDSFAGRADYHQESLRDAQKESVKRFLIMLLSEDKSTTDKPIEKEL